MVIPKNQNRFDDFLTLIGELPTARPTEVTYLGERDGVHSGQTEALLRGFRKRNPRID